MRSTEIPGSSVEAVISWNKRTERTLALLSVAAITALFLAQPPDLARSRSDGPQQSSSAVFVPAPDKEHAAGQPKSVGTVVTQALAFRDMLSGTQLSSLQLTYSTTLARKWSNLPCGASCRNGVQLGSLTTAQHAAAMAVVREALSDNASNGYGEYYGTNMAEAYLHANGGGSGYDSTLRWMAFLNEPSATGAWMLQFGGHHYAANIAFNDGHVIGATPFFMGVEPKSFTYGGTAYAPLDDERAGLATMLASLSSAELTTATLSGSFSDCVMIPGETNGGTGTFPANPSGISCASLTTTQKNLVLDAIRNYVYDVDSATADAIMAVYTSEIDQTYIGFKGSGTSGNASSFLVSSGNYARIDGPTVWVEFSCQNGVVIQGQIHYHTVWRDEDHDYGVDLSGPAIDISTSIVEDGNSAEHTLTAYPNPSNDQLAIELGAGHTNLELRIHGPDGRLVERVTNVSSDRYVLDVSKLAPGTYTLVAQEGSALRTLRFVRH